MAFPITGIQNRLWIIVTKSLLHNSFDADLYSSTICALNNAKPVIDQHTIPTFDEFIINKDWGHDEYKALEEFCVNNDYTNEDRIVLAFDMIPTK